ncbi:MAG TPA: alpha/beta hydrolase [Miltoncostaeaceae bacterium]|nr:alpha/beta hydrolase [Miltoncostaeaceae bacterium]
MSSDSGARSVNGVRLHYEERGHGAPILCVHGAGSSALAWAGAVDRLAQLGRVIAYDRRGCGRSERPEPYDRTTVGEHAEDAAGLLDALAPAPAVIVGRSFGGWVATELALRRPDRVLALALLEPDAPGLSAAADAWVSAFADRMRGVAADAGVDAVGEALIAEVAGEDAWRSLPDGVRAVFTGNGPALLAELRAYEDGGAGRAALAAVAQPVLLVTAADSPPEFHEPVEALAGALPNARTVLVEGGHIIDPGSPEVVAFIEEVVDAG